MNKDIKILIEIHSLMQKLKKPQSIFNINS